MKMNIVNTVSRISLVTALAAFVSVINSARADGVLRSPKLADLQIRTVAGAAHDPDLAHPVPPAVLLSPLAAANRNTVAANRSSDPDLAHAAGFMPGGSYLIRAVYAQQVKALGLKDFELAPLK